MCSPEVRSRYAAGEPPFTADAVAKRTALDAFTKRIFDSYRLVAGGSSASAAPRTDGVHRDELREDGKRARENDKSV